MKLFDHEKKHLRELRKSAAGCTLFLKKNGDFPLDAPCEIGLYGSGARQTRKGGTGSGDVNSRFYVTAEKGLIYRGERIINWCTHCKTSISDAVVEYEEHDGSTEADINAADAWTIIDYLTPLYGRYTTKWYELIRRLTK